MRLYPAPEHRSFTFGRSRRRALLLHGFPGTPWELRAVGELLEQLGFEAHAPLLPGFGPEIGSLGARSWRDWEASARSRLDELAPGAHEILLVGYSMGAALALLLAGSREAAPAQRLVLINPFSGVGFPLGALLSLATPVLSSYRPFVRADFNDPWIREVLGRVLPDLDIDDLNWRERLRREVRIPISAVEQARRLGALAWRASLSVDVPTLVVQGSDDTVVSPPRTRRFVRRLAGPTRYRETVGGHVLVWPGKAGHDELRQELRRFLGRADGHLTVTAASRRTR